MNDDAFSPQDAFDVFASPQAAAGRRWSTSAPPTGDRAPPPPAPPAGDAFSPTAAADAFSPAAYAAADPIAAKRAVRAPRGYRRASTGLERNSDGSTWPVLTDISRRASRRASTFEQD